MSKPSSEAPRRKVLFALAALAAALTAVRLRTLPVFGDEAIFLRHARLVREDPGRYLWTSLNAAAGPIHTWLLAVGLLLGGDPVTCGRVVSLACHVASIGVIAWVTGRIARMDAAPPAVDVRAALFAACLLATSPFFVTSARLARVDGLFALETIAIAGLSLRLAHRVAEGRAVARAGIQLGIVMGITMLTRTAVSYPFWAMPVAALLLGPPPRAGTIRRAAVGLFAAMAVALAIFAPYLISEGPGTFTTRVFHFSETRPALSWPARFHLAVANGSMAVEALSRYLTVPVALAVTGSMAILAGRRRWRVLLYCGAWEAVALLPAVLFAGAYFPRYVLPAAAPLLVIVAVCFSEMSRDVSEKLPAPLGSAVAGALAVAILVVPAIRSATFVRDGLGAPWMAVDRWQLVCGWPAGSATERAAGYMARQGAAEPVLVLTPEISGNPTDAIWLLLSNRPGIDLAFARDALALPLRVPASDGAADWLVRRDLLRGGEPRRIPLADRRPVLFVSPDPVLTRSGDWQPAGEFFRRLNPGLTEAARFENPGGCRVTPARDAVVVLRVR